MAVKGEVQIAEDLVTAVLAAAGTGALAGEIGIDQRLRFRIFSGQEEPADLGQRFVGIGTSRPAGGNRTTPSFRLKRSARHPLRRTSSPRGAPFPSGGDSVKWVAGESNQIWFSGKRKCRGSPTGGQNPDNIGFESVRENNSHNAVIYLIQPQDEAAPRGNGVSIFGSGGFDGDLHLGVAALGDCNP